jgi:hypothetical protein
VCFAVTAIASIVLRTPLCRRRAGARRRHVPQEVGERALKLRFVDRSRLGKVQGLVEVGGKFYE